MNTVFSFIDGQKKTLKDYTGQWLLVNFWSVSCPPCVEEMPDLSRLHSELNNEGFNVIGIAMPFDPPDMVVQTRQHKQLSYPIAIDIKGEANNAFGKIQVIPTSFLINPDGRVARKYTGVISYDGFKKELSQQQSVYKKGS